uniref:Uncharacterized protein n=1 Tax=Grammatophora oceanica TaxID=210454 RepID=A0A7S1Y2G6_9STRA|mmetsp:Transcript_2113/g.2838  ORF Transcript_2113/g.2838 Transcript_2113/m.2838 type:complete len:280 (+) Transcript_2113:139-978(+)|eukprot:CAMPEP_0194049174 /NCGR_PEP_ID=MMETSP0009_2-20130614/29916_1 /TAXON_ID=210454 /ORGANISM="Grammatophora oceanica, Strain CCMP 410" /LENGTH=279 /DNA_ID=CAMNT_0038695261 /DNA_START=139 /DNA_END=978 /DNA_ORIENTATION=-
MVRRGGFRVELVDAVTKEPFPEFEDEQRGITFVQVTLNQEYFVLVESDWGDQVLCKIMVDGTSLGYDTKLRRQNVDNDEPRRPSYCGAWCYRQGSSVDRALKFVRTTQTPRPQGERGSFWSGSIEVIFYEAIFDGYRTRKDRIPEWNGEDPEETSSPPMGRAAKKGIKVKQGELSHSKEKTGFKRKYRKGDVLSIIELTYCAADFSSLGIVIPTNNEDSNPASASNDEPNPATPSPVDPPTLSHAPASDSPMPGPPPGVRARARSLLRRSRSWRPSGKS